IPDEFQLRPIEKTKARFNMLKRLMQRPDVDLLINACDAGREGELIFRYLVKLSGVKKPIRRLWLQSMTTESIREAFNRLRSEEISPKTATKTRGRSGFGTRRLRTRSRAAALAKRALRLKNASRPRRRRRFFTI